MAELKLGQVVYSKAGRDYGMRFVIVDIIDDTYVLVSDGDLRRLEKPKKKKIKHLTAEDTVIQVLNEKLLNKSKVSNSEIRKLLAALDDQEAE